MLIVIFKLTNNILFCSDSPYDIYELIVDGKAFLWHQIRCIVAVLLFVAQGKEQPSVSENTFLPL